MNKNIRKAKNSKRAASRAPSGPRIFEAVFARPFMMGVMNATLQILYEDNHVLAVAKPAPLLTQAIRSGVAEPAPSLENMVREHIRVRYGKPGNVYLGIPHRLDRPVSRVLRLHATRRQHTGSRSNFKIAGNEQRILGGGRGDARSSQRRMGKLAAKGRRQSAGGNRNGGSSRSKTRTHAGLSGADDRCWPKPARDDSGNGSHASAPLAEHANGLPVLGDALYGQSTSFWA